MSGVVREAVLSLAARAPDRLAYAPLEDSRRAMTRRELLQRACGLARAARERAGDEPVLVVLENGALLAVAFVASVVGGFPVALLGASTPDAEVRATAGRLGARLAVASRCLEGLRTLDPGDVGPSDEAPQDAGRWSVILHTSGTTAVPKLVLREAAALDAVAENTVDVLGLSEHDRVLAAIPMTHSYGLEHGLLAPLLAGAAVETMRTFHADRAGERLATGVTVFPGVPVMFEALAGASSPPAGARELRLVYSAGAPLPEATRVRFEERWRARIGHLYGSTDVGSVVFNSPADAAFDPAFVGRPMRGVSIRIVDEPAASGRDVPSGRPGHIVIRAPSMLTRYVDGPEPQRLDGHLVTGDLGLLDPEKGLRITGRAALLLDIDGRKVNPAEVEEALAKDPRVAGAVVLPLPLTPTINRLRAIIEPRDAAAPPPATELRAALRTQLDHYKVPRVFEFVERLPRSESGKVLRHVLEQAEQACERR